MLSSLETKLAKEKEDGGDAVADTEAKTLKKRGLKKEAKGKAVKDEAEDDMENPSDTYDG